MTSLSEKYIIWAIKIVISNMQYKFRHFLAHTKCLEGFEFYSFAEEALAMLVLPKAS